MPKVMVASRNRMAIAMVVALVFATLSAQLAFAGRHGSGKLDPRFGERGKVLTSFDGAATSLTPAAGGASPETWVIGLGQQPSGKLVAMGQHLELGNAYFALARYNDDCCGSLDQSFGTGGKLVLEIGSGAPVAMAIQPDGKIVLAGWVDNTPAPIFEPASAGCATYDFLLVRLLPDGAPDSSFGTGGTVTTDFGGCDYATSVAIQTDGMIVAAGSGGIADDVVLARYDSAGVLDPGFGTGGKVAEPVGAVAQSLAIQPGGDIVVGAYTGTTFVLAGYTDAGSLDPTFGSSGITTTSFGAGNQAFLWSIAIRGSGGIVAAGGNYDGAKYNFALAGYDSSGNLDLGFGAGGKLLTDFSGPSGEDQAYGVAVQSDGKVVAAGYSCSNSDCDFALGRYSGSDGSLDTTFGSGGLVRTDFASGSGDIAHAAMIETDGKIVAGGLSDALSATGAFALARYRP